MAREQGGSKDYLVGRNIRGKFTGGKIVLALFLAASFLVTAQTLPSTTTDFHSGASCVAKTFLGTFS